MSRSRRQEESKSSTHKRGLGALKETNPEKMREIQSKGGHASGGNRSRGRNR